MEYKSNNGVYTVVLHLRSPSLTQVHRFHGRQIIFPQFNYRPHATFMTIIIPFFFWEARTQSVLSCSSVSFLVYTLSTLNARHHVRNGAKSPKNTSWNMDNNKTKDIVHENNYPAAPTISSPSPSASASPSPSASISSSPSASAECSKYIGSRTSASASARSSASSWLGGTCATRTRAHLSRKRSIG